jgi:hypothetical protein
MKAYNEFFYKNDLIFIGLFVILPAIVQNAFKKSKWGNLSVLVQCLLSPNKYRAPIG